MPSGTGQQGLVLQNGSKALSIEAKSPAREGSCVSPHGADGSLIKLGRSMRGSHALLPTGPFATLDKMKSWMKPFLSGGNSRGTLGAARKALNNPATFYPGFSLVWLMPSSLRPTQAPAPCFHWSPSQTSCRAQACIPQSTPNPATESCSFFQPH